MAFGYRRWRAKRIAELESAGEVVETARGPVEFSRRGGSPNVVLFHGGPGGHDQGFAADPLVEAGFGNITPSRPGYLRTPLSVGRTFEEQADAIAALLDALEIDQVAVYGLSAGGPCAIQFAARHPDRTRVLLLACAVTQRYRPEIPAWARALFLSSMGTWLQLLMFDRFPESSIQGLLREESTYSAKERTREAARIARDPRLLGITRQLLEAFTPYDLRKAGLDNDLVQLAAIEHLPFEKIRCPTLIAHGTADGDAPFADAEAARRRIRNAELYRMEGAWHLLNLSVGADALIARQLQFLKEHFAADVERRANST
jgi:pimeloyl-ACP methyl ester carboxylesterase